MNIPTREVYVRSFGTRTISSEKYESAAMENGMDNKIFFYVPDDIFKLDDYEVSEYVSNNVY